MKSNIISTSELLLLFTSPTYSQRQAEIKNSQVKGIFLTAESFKNKTFSCTIDTLQKDIKIKLNQFFISPEISCVNPDKERVFYTNSIFAIQLTNGDNFRFINRNPSLIVATLFLYIYTYKTIKTEHKQSGPTRRAREILVTNYYFSSGTHQDVYALTIDNLCKYLHLDPPIQVAMSQKFSNDEMLYSINTRSGHFLLNEFLNELTNKK